MATEMPSELQIDGAPTYPRWVELIHRLRWPIAVVGAVAYGFMPPDAPKWLPPVAFFGSALGFWITDVVGWVRGRWTRAPGSAAAPDQGRPE